MIFRLVELYGIVLEVAGFYYILHVLHALNEKKGTFFLYFIGQCAIIRMMNLLIGPSSAWIFALALAMFILGGRFFFHTSFSKAIGVVILYIAFFAVVEIATTFLMVALLNVDVNLLFVSNAYRAAGIVISKTLVFCIVFFAVPHIKKRSLGFDAYSVLAMLMMIASISAFYLAANVYSEARIESRSLMGILVVTLIIAMINILMLILLRRRVDLKEKEAQWKAVQKEYRNLTDYLTEYEDLVKEMRAMNHDFNNHIISINRLAADAGNQGIIAYTDQLLCGLDGDLVLDIDNKLTAALINYKTKFMEKEGIAFSHEIVLSNDHAIDDLDFTIVLGNLLDNAIEACQFCRRDERWIDLLIKEGYGRVMIQMRNPSERDLSYCEGIIATTKADSKSHGMGLKNVQCIVDKYEGLMKIDADKGVFDIQVLL